MRGAAAGLCPFFVFFMMPEDQRRITVSGISSALTARVPMLTNRPTSVQNRNDGKAGGLPQLGLRLILRLFLPALLLGLVCSPPALAQLQPGKAGPGQSAAPEPGVSRVNRPLVIARRHLVSAANPMASEAGREMLRKGGSAVDAAIAAQLVLGLVEPQSSGLGGGGFMLVATPDGKVITYDGRETAPADSGPDRFLDNDGKPLPFFAALNHGRAVGTPGTVALLALVHEKHGKLPWADLFAPAIRMAEEGVPTPVRLANVLSKWRTALEAREDLAQFFYAGGQPPAVGQIFRNPLYAATLRRLAAEGPALFYRGAVAEDIVARLKKASGDSGVSVVSMADLAGYKAVVREPVCGTYRVWTVCSMAPPSSGGVAVLQALKLLEPFDLARMGPQDPKSWHLIAEAERLAYADRDAYVADPEKVNVPVRGLIDPGYLRDRGRLINPGQAAGGPVAAGTPPWREGRAPPQSPEDPWPSTSHLVAADSGGMTVSYTTTIEFAFGSGLMVDGFILNNQLTDFTFSPTSNGQPVANRPDSGKRPRSSTSPAFVLDQSGQVRFAIGSAGGPDIIGHVIQSLVGLLDWQLDPQAAISMPMVINRNGNTAVESGVDSDALAAALAAMGHVVQRRETPSGLHALERRDGEIRGAADPRREGAAVGD
jgi:gamma-glutamyltranspeptidase / glutathione hydrolase